MCKKILELARARITRSSADTEKPCATRYREGGKVSASRRTAVSYAEGVNVGTLKTRDWKTRDQIFTSRKGGTTVYGTRNG